MDATAQPHARRSPTQTRRCPAERAPGDGAVRRPVRRARDQLRDRRRRAARARPRAVRRARRSASPRPAAGCSPTTTPTAGRSPTAGCRRSRTRRRTCCCRRRSTTATCRCSRPGSCRARSARSTSSSRCCTARSARTARCRGCSSWPTCATSGAGVLASAVGMDKHMMKLVLAGHGLPVGPFVVLARRASSTATPSGVTARVGRSACPLFVKPARAGSSLGISRVDDLADLPAAIEAAARARPEGRRRGRPSSAARSSAACSAATTATARARRCPARSSSPTPATTSTTSRPSTSTRPASTLACPADLPDDVVARGPGRRRAHVRGRRLRGPGARRRVRRRPTARSSSTRSTRCPGFTPFSMYPRMWQASGRRSTPSWSTSWSGLALHRPTGLR